MRRGRNTIDGAVTSAHDRARALLEHLETELEDLDRTTRGLLADARHEIREATRHDAAERVDSARRRLELAIQRIESRHPNAVAALQRVLDALANVGL